MDKKKPLIRTIVMSVLLFGALLRGDQFVYQIRENSPIDTKFGNLISDLGLSRENLDFDSLTFQLFPSRQEGRAHFKVVQQQGHHWSLGITSNFDRESECSSTSQYCQCDNSKDNCSLQLSIAMNPLKDSMKIFTIRVKILDENDNRPVFKSDNYTVEFSESDKVGSVRRIPIAEDSDDNGNNRINYFFKDATYSDVFGLNYYEEKGVLEMTLLRELDREDKSNYELMIIAQDSKEPTFIATLPITVIIGDVNDCQPKFRHFPTNEAMLRIAEDVQVGETLIDLTADDCDIGNNARISYEIHSDQYAKYFDVNKTTSMLIVKSQLDREKMPEMFDLKITIKDHGSPITLKENLHVRITLLDVNDNSPEIRLTEDLDHIYMKRSVQIDSESFRQNKILPEIEVMKLPVNAEIKENREIGKIITFLTVNDKDDSLNGSVSCYLANEYINPQKYPQPNEKVVSDLRIFEHLNSYTINQVELVEDHLNVLSKDSKVYRLQTKHKFDAELISDIIVEVVCEDSCNASYDCKKISNRWLRIKVTDSNDFRPRLERVHLIADKSVVSFTDYDPNTRSLNHDSIKDNGVQISVSESAPINTKIFQFIAVDQDTGTYGQLSYYFTESRLNQSGPFLISQHSGEVILTENIDRETRDNYTLNILIVDKESDNIENEQCFSINFDVDLTVMDINDEKPDIYLVLKSNYDHDVILRPTNHTAVINIREDANELTDIYPKFYISDRDLKSSLHVNMLLIKDEIAQVLDNPFDLININGYQRSFNKESSYYSLVLKGHLDRESISQYKYRIICVDSDQADAHTSSIDLTVNIINIQENLPRLLKKSTYHASLTANVGDELFHLDMNDKSPPVEFHIVETKCNQLIIQDDLFSIPDKKYGGIVLKKKLGLQHLGECTLLLRISNNRKDSDKMTIFDTINIKISEKTTENLFNNTMNDLPYSGQIKLNQRFGQAPKIDYSNDESTSAEKRQYFQVTLIVIFSVILLSGVILLTVGLVLTMTLCQRYNKRTKPTELTLTKAYNEKVNYDNPLQMGQNPVENMSLSSYNFNSSTHFEMSSPKMNVASGCFSPVLSHHSNTNRQILSDSNYNQHCNQRPEHLNTYQPCNFDYSIEEVTALNPASGLIKCQSFKPSPYMRGCQSPQIIGKPINEVRFMSTSCFDNQDSDSGHGQGTDHSSNAQTGSDLFNQTRPTSFLNTECYNLIV